jgi:hypothetical protein
VFDKPSELRRSFARATKDYHAQVQLRSQTPLRISGKKKFNEMLRIPENFKVCFKMTSMSFVRANI